MRRIATQATRCLDQEFAWRGLAIPDELDSELHALCLYPETGIEVCRERLERGSALIERRGGNQAPDALWDRFEALLATWLCCEAAVQAERERNRRRMRREYAHSLTRPVEPRHL